MKKNFVPLAYSEEGTNRTCEDCLYVHILDQLPVCTIFYDSKGRVVYRNRMTRVIDGYADEEMLGLHRTQYLKKLQIKANSNTVFTQPAVHNNNFSEGVFALNETTLTTKSGEVKNVYLVGGFVYDNNGQLLGAAGCCLDITDYIRTKKEMEAKVHLLEERFYKAFYHNPNPMAIVRFDDDKYLDVNKSFERIYGYRREEVIGKTAVDINLFVDLSKFRYFKETLARGESIHNLNVFLRTRSGDVRNVLLSGEVINLNGETCRLITISDITEFKKVEHELERLEKMNIIGQMAATIAHEVRNPLTTVRGFLQLLLERHDFSPYQEYLEIMVEEIDRVNKIISEFLALARIRPVCLQAKNINKIVRDIFPLLQIEALNSNKGIKLELEEVPDLWVDETEIKQLLINLARNGLEAMPENGTLIIRTKLNREEIILSVQDQGKGIDAEVIPRLGTPFYTTKSNGTGLGLAICYSIAARHNARIEIDTGPTGTTVHVKFPCHTRAQR